MPDEPRIINPLYCAKLHHRRCFSLTHDFIPFPRTAVSRFATSGSPALLPRWASPRALSKLSAGLAVPILGRLLSPPDLHGSGTSESRTVLPKQLWRGPEKETARVPPSLDSPLSAAPETFLSRDAVSAFPIAFGTLPQPLPGAPYRVSAALSQLPWRSFWNRAHPPRGRANWPVPFPATDSQFRLPSIHLRHSFSCPMDRPRGKKIRAPPGQAACSK